MLARLTSKVLPCVGILALAASCTPADPDASATRTLTVSFAHVAGLQVLQTGLETPYTTPLGTTFGVARLTYFVSNLRLKQANGDRLALGGVAYVDVKDPSTLQMQVSLPLHATGNTLMFTVGMGPQDNTSGRFELPPQSLMEWPQTMGGGYHHMKLEGRYRDAAGQAINYTVHTGPLNGSDYSVTAEVPLNDLVLDDGAEVELVMDVTRWFEAYDLNAYGAGVMNIPAAQALLQTNGARAFSVGYTGPLRHTEPTAPPQAVTLDYPAGVPIPMVVPLDNPTTAQGVALGRRLYYDPQLDGVASRACADCHHQGGAFSSTNGTGVLPHINLGFNTSFLWDGLVSSGLEDAMVFEVEEFFATSVDRLGQDAVYPPMFEAAFGPGSITTQKAAYALAQFQRTLLSFNSRYDQHLRGEVELNASERRGMEVFFTEAGDCFHCHGTLLFTDNLFHNTGLDMVSEREGLMAVTHDAADRGRFKTPTLRNIALTAPYMHDDRYGSLGQVINFYSEGLHNAPGIDPLMKRAATGGIQLTPLQKADLLAFLQTLSDTTFTTDPALASPF